MAPNRDGLEFTPRGSTVPSQGGMMIAVTVEGRFATPVAKGATMRTSAATLALVAVTMAAAAYPVVSSAQTVEAFYKGKTIDLIVGGAAGGGYDIYGRAV